MNYYEEIKDTLVKNEVYKRAKDYSKNKNDLASYYEVGRLLIEAQGGESKASYGDELIKIYSGKLTRELGKGYSTRSLRKMRQFYSTFKKWPTVSAKLTWSHYVELLKINAYEKMLYYYHISETHNLSVRELRERIKSNEYERIGYKEELENPKVSTLIKNPVIIKTTKSLEKVTEYALHKFVLEDIDNFLKELGVGFAYIGSEVKIKIGDYYHRIDLLLFNYKYNCFIVVELKVTPYKSMYAGQVMEYINYVDENIKEPFNEKTVGVVICKEANELVIKYCSDPRIFVAAYRLNNVFK